MAKYVNDAFKEFMDEVVNLDPDIVFDARQSRDNLLDNISEFDDGSFFKLFPAYNIQFGSFARKTKNSPLNDIDLMIGINAEGNSYRSDDSWNSIRMEASKTSKCQQLCSNDDGSLNSTKVLNMFKKKLESLRDYKRSEIHKNGEAVTINLKSYGWNFDVVPCFHTVKDGNMRDYYLIPNGNGLWKKTDPRKDRDTVARVNNEKDKKVLELVRLCKKWNQVKKNKTIPSYLLETMIVEYCDTQVSLDDNLKIRFKNALSYIQTAVWKPVWDMKEIEGDINNLTEIYSFSDVYAISEKAKSDVDKIGGALYAEKILGNHQVAISLWQDVFGQDFPSYDK